MTTSNGADRQQLLGRLDAQIEKLVAEFVELNVRHWGRRLGNYHGFEWVPQSHETERRVIDLALELDRLRFTRSCVVAGVLPVNGNGSHEIDKADAL